MILDYFCYFSGGEFEADADQAIGATGTTGYVSTNVKNQGTGGQDIGTGENLYAVCLVTSDLPSSSATSGSPTLSVKLRAATNAALTGSPSDATLGSFALGTTGAAEGAAAGSALYLRVPPGFGKGKQYLGGWYQQSHGITVGTANPAGRVQLFLTDNIQKWEAKADNPKREIDIA